MIPNLQLTALLFLFFLISLGFSYVLTKVAPLIGLLDEPNHRSSHKATIPRGGGLAFAICFFFGVTLLNHFGVLENEWLMPLIIGGPLVTLIGLLDDRWSLSARFRLFIHFVAALVSVLTVTKNFVYDVNISFLFNQPYFVVIAFCMLFVAWMINLFNFVDGIDGLLASQSYLVALISAAHSLWQGNMTLYYLYALLAVVVAGFLCFNWSPAKIFMGDAGAYFLGFSFAILALTGKVYGAISLNSQVILLGVIIADATYTLIARLVRKEKIYQAHRTHAFQKLTQKGLSHPQVCMIYNGITLVWLTPLAIASISYPDYSNILIFVAYVPLFFGCVVLKAGVPKFTF